MNNNDAETEQSRDTGRYPTLYELVPDFDTETTKGPIRLSEWYPDKWVLFFSHPADFTPVCTSEFIELSKRQEEFEALDTKLLGLSVDSIYSHIGWLENIREAFDIEINFPVIPDNQQKIAQMYGMIHPRHASSSAVRSVFVLDTERRLRARLQYPREMGRNVDELLRLVEGLKIAQNQDVELPANWRPGDRAVQFPPKTSEDAKNTRGSETNRREWYYIETEATCNSNN